MNKHKEVWQIIKRLDDAKIYVEPAMSTDLSHVTDSEIEEASAHIERLFFLLEKIVYKRYLVHEVKEGD